MFSYFLTLSGPNRPQLICHQALRFHIAAKYTPHLTIPSGDQRKAKYMIKM